MQMRQPSALRMKSETWRPSMINPNTQSFQPKRKTLVKSRLEHSGLENVTESVDHPVLSRLIEEVRNERNVEASYDRVHNRHNRGR